MEREGGEDKRLSLSFSALEALTLKYLATIIELGLRPVTAMALEVRRRKDIAFFSENLRYVFLSFFLISTKDGLSMD